MSANTMSEIQNVPHAMKKSRAGNIISISSGKGGVGKTWCAISLCHSLARDGAKVLLFDGDLGLANIDVQLGLMPRHDLSSVFSGQRSLQGAITQFEEGGFDIIAGQSGSTALAAISARRLAELCEHLHELADAYDFVVMDLGAGIDRTVQTLMSGADRNIVLTTEEPTSLTDAYATIKLMARAGNAGSVSIIVNMAGDSRSGEHTYRALLKACENFLHISPPLAGIIRRDKHVADSIRHQASMFMRHPNCEAAEDIAAIASKIGSKT